MSHGPAGTCDNTSLRLDVEDVEGLLGKTGLGGKESHGDDEILIAAPS
jgi:hypothetical protein